MNFNFKINEMIPNYVFYDAKVNDYDTDWFLDYLEENVKPYFNLPKGIFFKFDFGRNQIDLSYSYLTELLFKYKIQGDEQETLSERYIPADMADFLNYFNLIDKTKEGYKIVDNLIEKKGSASFPTLLGHLIVEKNLLQAKKIIYNS